MKCFSDFCGWIGLRVFAVFVLLTLVGAPHAFAITYTPPASNRAAISLNGNWKFIKSDVAGGEAPNFDDTTWSGVAVPHTWNNLDGQDGPSNGYYRGVGFYRRHFSVPTTYSGRKLFVQFDGANIVADVWLNGFYIGRHEGGFTAFRFDVTSLLNTTAGNDNLIAVRVDNSAVDIAPLAGDFTFFGGIYRDVTLIATDLLSAEMLDYGSPGVYLTPTSVSQASANLQIKTLVNNGNPGAVNVTVKSVILDANSNIVQTAITSSSLGAKTAAAFTQNISIAAPRLWDGLADPYLYSVYVEIHEGSDTGPVRDVIPPQPLGFRYFSLDSNQGFTLNGHYLDLHGVNRHQDRLSKGWAISQSDQDQDMSLIREIGATAVRLAHYPHAQYFYSLADQNGVVVWAELPVVNKVGDQSFANNAAQQLTELIRQNYNHPAIIFWSIGNEVTLDPGPDPNPLLTQLNALAKQQDPFRITTLAQCCGDAMDPVSNKTDTLGYNTYFGWYGGNYDDFAYWADLTHNANPARPFAVSEYGAGASISFHSDNPVAQDHTEEYQARFHEVYWLAMKTRPYLWGKFVWNLFDFASDSRNEGDTPGRNDKGLVTYDHQTRKDSFYWYKANWTTSPMVYITSRRWTQRTAPITDIKVYSNMDSVELIVNGVSLGTIAAATSPDHIFKWTNVTLSNGSNAVQAIGLRGGATVADAVSWNLASSNVVPPTGGGGFSAHIDFQASGATYPGYVADVGAAFGDRGNGLSYGWSQDNTSLSTGEGPRTRGDSISPDQRYDTLVHMGALSWEIAVPNGTYTVHAVVGDPSYTDVVSKLTVEGTLTINNSTTSSAHWLEGTVTVSVNDGRLTVGNLAGSYNKICFIDISPAGNFNQPPPVTSPPVTGESAFSTKVNFQAEGATYPGYVADVGAAFGDRGNGLSYGWSQDNTSSSSGEGPRTRGDSTSPDQRYDTLVHMGALNWEIAVPNGTYTVHAVVGDPDYTDVVSKLTIEGTLTIDGSTNDSAHWLQGSATVSVNDGRLTISNLAGSYNKICFVDISSVASPTQPGDGNQPPAVSIGSPANGATLTAPVTITVTANASDPDGGVTKVEFFDGLTKLGEDTDGADGWSLTWPNIPSGTYTVTAKATDNAAASSTSSPVTFAVGIRFDVGSSTPFTDTAGRLWQPDQFSTGGEVSSKSNSIGNTSDADLFRTYRYGNFNYDIPVANGTYDVYLKFIEPWWTAPGQRIFNVSAEGVTRLQNIDLYAEAGQFNAIEKTFSVVVTDGVLNLGFRSVIDNAIVSAIAILKQP